MRLTTLEEDFKKLGLDVESSDGSLEERRVAKRVSAGGRVRKATKRSSQAQKRAAKQYYRKHKSGILRGRKIKMKKPKYQKRAAFLAKMHGEGAAPSKIEKLLGEVKDLAGALDTTKQKDSIRAYANMAIMAEMLGHLFEIYSAEKDVPKEAREALEHAAMLFAGLAEDASEKASSLHSGSLAESEEDLAEDFASSMEILLDGLGLYAELSEEDDEDDDEDEDEEDDDDPDDGMCEDDDEEDDSGK